MNLNSKKLNKLNEKNFKRIIKHYKFTQQDAQALLSVQTLANKHSKELLDGFYLFIFEFDYAKMFLHNEEILKRHRVGIINWYLNLFCGKYDEAYFDKLNIISEIHVKINLPAHYVNAAFSFVRGFIKNILIKEKKFEIISSLDKIIDINLDILTIAYREEEQTKLIDEIIFLKNAVETENILPYFQPIFDAKTLKIEKYECLMRIGNSINDSVVSVFPYLNIAKKIKLYEEMMHIMFTKSLETICTKEFEFSLNLCYEDISNNHFREFIYTQIGTYSKSKKIIFEILESDFIEDFSIVEEFANRVRKLGCKIAIDDFGSGYSSMENILRLKPEIIKIDGSLIKNIDKSTESKMIVKNIVNMAKELKAQTVAEYVHTKEVQEITTNLGVDYLQGFHLGEPQTLD